MHAETDTGHTIVPVRTYVLVWLVLVIGTILTYLVAEYVDIGPWNIVVALLIAGTKMSLVIYFFMHVKFDDPLTRLFVGAGFFWLLILIFMTLTDYFTRDWAPAASYWHH
jgi:cytochrome c oxidase subunit IV